MDDVIVSEVAFTRARSPWRLQCRWDATGGEAVAWEVLGDVLRFCDDEIPKVDGVMVSKQLYVWIEFRLHFPHTQKAVSYTYIFMKLNDPPLADGSFETVGQLPVGSSRKERNWIVSNGKKRTSIDGLQVFQRFFFNGNHSPSHGISPLIEANRWCLLLCLLRSRKSSCIDGGKYSREKQEWNTHPDRYPENGKENYSVKDFLVVYTAVTKTFGLAEINWSVVWSNKDSFVGSLGLYTMRPKYWLLNSIYRLEIRLSRKHSADSPQSEPPFFSIDTRDSGDWIGIIILLGHQRFDLFSVDSVRTPMSPDS